MYFVATCAFLKEIVFKEEWMAATKETRRHCNKIFLGTISSDHRLFLNCYFTEIFIQLSVTRVFYLSVYKLIGLDPEDIYLFKATRCRICPKFTIKTVESCSGVFFVNFKHFSHFL